MNPFLIPFLTSTFVVVLYYTWNWWQQRHLRRFREVVERKESSASQRIWFGNVSKPEPTGFKGWQSLVGAGMGALLAMGVFETSPVFGLVLGGMAPYVTVKVWQMQRAKQERRDAKTALEFAGAVFSAGGTVEDWIRQVSERLEGPLRDTFARTAVEINRVGTPDVLAHLARQTIDPFLREALIGIRANYESAGDLQKFLDGVMEDIIQGERLERKMKGERNRFQQMQLAILAVPAFLYFVFRSDVDLVLRKHFDANVALLIGIVGYLAIFWLAYRASRTRTY